MTVAELIEKLKAMPPEAGVWMDVECLADLYEALSLRLDANGRVVIQDVVPA